MVTGISALGISKLESNSSERGSSNIGQEENGVSGEYEGLWQAFSGDCLATGIVGL